MVKKAQIEEPRENKVNAWFKSLVKRLSKKRGEIDEAKRSVILDAAKKEPDLFDEKTVTDEVYELVRKHNVNYTDALLRTAEREKRAKAESKVTQEQQQKRVRSEQARMEKKIKHNIRSLEQGARACAAHREASHPPRSPQFFRTGTMIGSSPANKTLYQNRGFATSFKPQPTIHSNLPIGSELRRIHLRGREQRNRWKINKKEQGNDDKKSAMSLV